MHWRRLCQVRAWSAAGLLSCTVLSAIAAEPAEPLPGADLRAETVGILDGQKAGDLDVVARGQGPSRVGFSIRNRSPRRLNVVLPPGLVAASATTQAGGLQSMGLGPTANNGGGFGQFRPSATEAGLRSIPADGPAPIGSVAVPAGQTVEFSVPSVCLNFGLPTPSPRDVFRLVDVDDYSTDLRVRKALKSLATIGTSQGVAQAVMWNVCNGVEFPKMVSAARGKFVNSHEAAIAARFVEAIDAGGADELVDPASLTEGRLFVKVRGVGPLAAEAKRLATELEGLRVMGLAVRPAGDEADPVGNGPALAMEITLTGEKIGKTEGRVIVRHATADGRWASLGQATFATGSAASVLDGPELSGAVERAVSSAFVTAKVSRRATGSTILKIENRLPFSIARVVVKAGGSAGAPSVPLSGLGIGPARAGQAEIQAATATVERVDLNGL